MSQLELRFDGSDICRNRHKGNESSKAANPKREAKRKMHQQIIGMLCRNTLTAKQIARALDVPFNTISGRFSELKAMGKIRGTGQRFEGSEYLEII